MDNGFTVDVTLVDGTVFSVEQQDTLTRARVLDLLWTQVARDGYLIIDKKSKTRGIPKDKILYITVYGEE